MKQSNVFQLSGAIFLSAGYISGEIMPYVLSIFFYLASLISLFIQE